MEFHVQFSVLGVTFNIHTLWEGGTSLASIILYLGYHMCCKHMQDPQKSKGFHIVKKDLACVNVSVVGLPSA